MEIPIIHLKDLEKYFVDNTKERIFLGLEFTKEIYEFILDIEQTFFYPIDKYRDEFNIFLMSPIGNLDCNKLKMKTKYEIGIKYKDGTLTSAAWLHKQIANFSYITLDIKKTEESIERIKYMITKHNLQEIIEIPEVYKKDFSEKKQKVREPISKSLRHEVFKRDNYKCVECGATNKELTLHIDHIIPKSEGGTDELNNLQTLCDKCNLSKSNRKWKGGE